MDIGKVIKLKRLQVVSVHVESRLIMRTSWKPHKAPTAATASPAAGSRGCNTLDRRY